MVAGLAHFILYLNVPRIKKEIPDDEMFGLIMLTKSITIQYRRYPNPWRSCISGKSIMEIPHIKQS